MVSTAKFVFKKMIKIAVLPIFLTPTGRSSNAGILLQKLSKLFGQNTFKNPSVLKFGGFLKCMTRYARPCHPYIESVPTL